MCATNTLSSPPRLNKVSAIDLILSPLGAVQGFPVLQAVKDGIALSVDLNALGWDNQTTAPYACRLVFQVKFTLSGITASEVGLRRMANRVGTAMGPNGQETKQTSGYDGPRPNPVTGVDVTVLRPSNSLIVVSDCPGFTGGGNKVFPITYHASFDLYAYDRISPGGTILAKVSYVIDIQKKTFDDASPSTNLSNVVKQIFKKLLSNVCGTHSEVCGLGYGHEARTATTLNVTPSHNVTVLGIVPLGIFE